MTEAPETIWAIPDTNQSRGYGVWYQDQQFHNGNPLPDQVEYRRADLPPKVKALVWEESFGVWRAYSPYGDYMVARGMLTLPLPMRPQQVHADEEAAKAAAQAHYETLVLSCLEITQ